MKNTTQKQPGPATATPGRVRLRKVESGEIEMTMRLAVERLQVEDGDLVLVKPPPQEEAVRHAVHLAEILNDWLTETARPSAQALVVNDDVRLAALGEMDLVRAGWIRVGDLRFALRRVLRLYGGLVEEKDEQGVDLTPFWEAMEALYGVAVGLGGEEQDV